MEAPEAADSEAQLSTLGVDESRVIELRYSRFDVKGFEQRLSLDALAALPRPVVDQIWLLDLDLFPLTQAALEKLGALSPEQAASLSIPAQNLRRLMTMTPDNANLDGTSLGPLIELSAAVGIPPARALANLLGIGVTDPLAPSDIAAQVFVEQLVATHPNAHWRPGPINDEHPEGLYPVAIGHIPVTLGDVVDQFSGLAARFGPTSSHPGVVTNASDITFATDEFLMSVKVTANVLPFRGVDLTSVSEGSVNSVPAQFDGLFDFDDPDWMGIVGISPEPSIGALTIRVTEDPSFVPGGTSTQPQGQGDSPVWSLPLWTFESIIAEESRRTTLQIPAHCDAYELGTGTTAFEACIDADGWTTLTTFANLGMPPEPAYLWDYVLEIAQFRLHDGGLAEGEATADLALYDIPLGIDADTLVAQAKQNLESAPDALRELARALTNTAVGDPDFFYMRDESPTEEGTDWLFFTTEDDLRRDGDGDPTKSYDYQSPGFFTNAGLTEKVSSTQEVNGDTSHEKIEINPGDIVYAADDEGRVFKIEVGNKRSRRRILLRVTRRK